MYRVLLCTCPGITVARLLATACVESRLAACVNIIPQTESIYRWEDQIEHTEESLLLIKTTEANYEPLVKFMQQNHPYDVPEIIEIAISRGHEPYLQWIKENC